jgi:multisubunit Na+/H+ antiporter MnhE subunit
MKKENRNLIIGIIIGVATGLVSDAIFEFRTAIMPWITNNFFAFLFVTCFIVALIILATKPNR